MLAGIPNIWAWSDEVDGVLMPAPRGGGGISGEEAESEMYSAQEGSSSDPQALIEWE
jgi:hypothetical protein